jgi:hypothetical protein
VDGVSAPGYYCAGVPQLSADVREAMALLGKTANEIADLIAAGTIGVEE